LSGSKRHQREKPARSKETRLDTADALKSAERAFKPVDLRVFEKSGASGLEITGALQRKRKHWKNLHLPAVGN